MDHTDVLLRRTQIARILEGDPGMAGFEQHREHLAPQIDCPNLLVNADTPRFGICLGVFVGRLERLAIEVVEIGHLVGRKQHPGAILLHALHEQVRHPIGGIHVMGATAVVAGVLTQIEKFLDVDVPGFEIGANRSLALATLIDGDGRIVGDLQKRHHALAFAIGTLDMGAQSADRRPVIAQSARIFGKQGVVPDAFEDCIKIVANCGQEAR